VTSARITSRAMSLPSVGELELLDAVAYEVREVLDERGYRVQVALDADPAFGSGNSRSWLTRDLVLDAITRKAAQLGLPSRAVNGSGRELVGEAHRYRILKASRDRDGNIIIRVGSDSSLILQEDETLLPSEPWVFGFIVDDDGCIAEVFIARIDGYEDGRPGCLILGPERIIGARGTPPIGGGFQPADEGLEGIDDEDNEEDEGGRDAG
jgi:hypothetical protein